MKHEKGEGKKVMIVAAGEKGEGKPRLIQKKKKGGKLSLWLQERRGKEIHD